MQFHSDILPYLDGTKFSNGMRIKVSHKEKSIINRLDLLEELSRGKKIIHIGFADHLPLIAQKIQSNTWLHKRLQNASKECIGIDIDKEVVEFVKKEFNIQDVYCLDIIKDELPEKISSSAFDYLILGEVLEHIDNPVDFLKSIKQKFKGCANSIIITVPNAWSLANLQTIKRNEEFINTDHRYWFTPYTLAKVGVKAGLRVVEFFTVQNYPIGKRLKKWLLQRFPLLRSTIVMVFEI